jgi:hypothetical protein
MVIGTCSLIKLLINQTTSLLPQEHFNIIFFSTHISISQKVSIHYSFQTRNVAYFLHHTAQMPDKPQFLWFNLPNTDEESMF